MKTDEPPHTIVKSCQPVKENTYQSVNEQGLTDNSQIIRWDDGKLAVISQIERQQIGKDNAEKVDVLMTVMRCAYDSFYPLRCAGFHHADSRI